MQEKSIEYQDGSDVMEGYLLAHDDGKARPTVLISHAWSGLGDFEKQKAQAIADLGYNAFALDMYGKGKRGKNAEENKQLMAPFLEDRALLRRRVVAGLKAVQAMELVDSKKIAAMGFCFGGLCVLDLARSGAAIQGVVSFHGFLTPLPESLPNELIKSKVLVLHGYEDPMVPPQQVVDLGTELSDAGVDWQIHAYGLTYHAFTNPQANDANGGKMFNPVADRRSWQALRSFLEELFE